MEYRDEFKATLRKDARANICHLIAGPAAGQIWDGEEVSLWEGDYTPRDDITKALGLAQLLHWRGEYEHLARLTEIALRQSDVWSMVLRLADELEQKGGIDEFEGLLPEPIPNWPSSVRTKPPHCRRAVTSQSRTAAQQPCPAASADSDGCRHLSF